jgi:hypothetical protein
LGPSLRKAESLAFARVGPLNLTLSLASLSPSRCWFATLMSASFLHCSEIDDGGDFWLKCAGSCDSVVELSLSCVAAVVNVIVVVNLGFSTSRSDESA